MVVPKACCDGLPPLPSGFIPQLSSSFVSPAPQASSFSAHQTLSLHGALVQGVPLPRILFLQLPLRTPFQVTLTQYHLLSEAPLVKIAPYLHPTIPPPTSVSCPSFSLSISPVTFQHTRELAYFFCFMFITCLTPLECKHLKGRRFTHKSSSALHLKYPGQCLESKNICGVLPKVLS